MNNLDLLSDDYYKFDSKFVHFDLSARKEGVQYPITENITLKITEDDDSISIANGNDVIAYILKIVGNKIQRLSITGYWSLDAENILKLIKQHCSESLVELHVKELKQFYKGIKKPFSKLETLVWTTADENDRLLFDEYKFTENFPALRNLELKSPPIAESVYKIPNLEYYSVIHATKDKTDDNINFLKANPQIKSLYLGRSDPYVLQSVANELPNLTKLRVEDFDRFGKSIHGNINFHKQLELTTDHWVLFYTQPLLNHTNFESLKLVDYIYLSIIREISSLELGVKHLDIAIREEADPPLVIELIESCSNLNKFNFKLGLEMRGKDEYAYREWMSVPYDLWDEKQLIIKFFSGWTFIKDDEDYIYSLTKN